MILRIGLLSTLCLGLVFAQPMPFMRALRLGAMLEKAGAPIGKDLRGKALTTYVLAKAHDGYEVVFSLGEVDSQFGNEPILLAAKRARKPLEEIRVHSGWFARMTRRARVRCGCSRRPRWCT